MEEEEEEIAVDKHGDKKVHCIYLAASGHLDLASYICFLSFFVAEEEGVFLLETSNFIWITYFKSDTFVNFACFSCYSNRLQFWQKNLMNLKYATMKAMKFITK